MSPLNLTPVRRRILRLLFNADAPLWSVDVAQSQAISHGTVYDTFRKLYDQGWAVGITEAGATGRPPRALYRLTETGRTEAAKILGEG